MNTEIKALNTALNQYYRKTDELYHAYASHCGLSDTAFWVLYTLCEADVCYTQNQLAELWCYPKQTVNFAISRLVKSGYIRLEPLSARNSKAVRLTTEGQQFCQDSILPLFEAEHQSLSRLTETERTMLNTILEKQYAFFHEEIQTLLQEENHD